MTRNRRPLSRGTELVQRLQQGCRLEASALTNNARNLAVLRGVTKACEFLIPQENVLASLGTILIESERVFRYGNAIVIEMNDGGRAHLANLTVDRHVEPAAVSLLANLVVCETASSENSTPIQFPLPKCLVDLILNHEPTIERLPKINIYASRPLFDAEFQLLGPGWHAGVGYLIHGPEIEPIVPNNRPQDGELINKLPRRLRELLADFCFKSETDMVNAVGALLTGLLVTLFVAVGKAIFVLDGNQPSVGKTFFGRVLGVLLDDTEPGPIKYTTNDEELEKKICANLRSSQSSILLFDNAKIRGGSIESAVIETNSTAPLINLRILGQSTNYSRPNDVLWLVTMNCTRLGSDMTARNCPIRFHFDGDPRTRPVVHEDLIQFVKRHRLELLGELAGMVIYWAQQGRQLGTQTHRLGNWARTIGGILDTNGLPGFLSNLDAASGEFNTALDQLAALAEAATKTTENVRGRLVCYSDSASRTNVNDVVSGLTAGELHSLFTDAGVLTEKLAECKSLQSRSTTIGAFLSQFANRTVPIEMPARPGTTGPRTAQATLQVIQGRARTKRYLFEIDQTVVEPSQADDGVLGVTQMPLAPAAMLATLPVAVCPLPADAGGVAGGNEVEW